MPWEKTFEESDVIEKTMALFWEKGYAATSISDITAATGIKRGSLYNAFHGKEDLFLQALLKYDNERRRKVLRQLESLDDPREAIYRFFDRIVETSLSDPHRRGCMLVNTSLDYAQHTEAAREVVTAAFKELTDFFERLIARGQTRGDIPETVEPVATANALLSFLVGIRVLGRGVVEQAALEQMADSAKSLIG